VKFLRGNTLGAFTFQRVQPAIKFGLLFGRKLDLFALGVVQALPQIFDERQALVRAHLADIHRSLGHASSIARRLGIEQSDERFERHHALEGVLPGKWLGGGERIKFEP